LFSCLTAWLAPVLCFTVEEAWLTRFPDAESVHLRPYPDVPAGWRDEKLAAKWEKLRELRRVVTGALELERANKKIGASLQAEPAVFADGRWQDVSGDPELLAEICITSSLTVTDARTDSPNAFTLPDVPGVAVEVLAAPGRKCARCWRVLREVKEEGGICIRCADAVKDRMPAAAGSGE